MKYIGAPPLTAAVVEVAECACVFFASQCMSILSVAAAALGCSGMWHGAAHAAVSDQWASPALPYRNRKVYFLEVPSTTHPGLKTAAILHTMNHMGEIFMGILYEYRE